MNKKIASLFVIIIVMLMGCQDNTMDPGLPPDDEISVPVGQVYKAQMGMKRCFVDAKSLADSDMLTSSLSSVVLGSNGTAKLNLVVKGNPVYRDLWVRSINPVDGKVGWRAVPICTPIQGKRCSQNQVDLNQFTLCRITEGAQVPAACKITKADGSQEEITNIVTCKNPKKGGQESMAAVFTVPTKVGNRIQWVVKVIEVQSSTSTGTTCTPACGAGQTCVSGTCKCQDGTTSVNGVCGGTGTQVCWENTVTKCVADQPCRVDADCANGLSCTTPKVANASALAMGTCKMTPLCWSQPNSCVLDSACKQDNHCETGLVCDKDAGALTGMCEVGSAPEEEETTTGGTGGTPATCFDKMQNAQETGIDCGGTCPKKCNGVYCIANAECSSNSCVDGLCTAATTGGTQTPTANLDKSCTAADITANKIRCGTVTTGSLIISGKYRCASTPVLVENCPTGQACIDVTGAECVPVDAQIVNPCENSCDGVKIKVCSNLGKMTTASVSCGPMMGCDAATKKCVLQGLE